MSSGVVAIREKQRERSHAWRQRQIEKGNCKDCGRPRGKDGTKTLCRACANRPLEWRQRRIEAGLCEDCGRPRGKNGTATNCRPCADEDATRSRERRRHLYENGECPRCHQPLGDDPTTSVCGRCAEEVAADARKRRGHKIEQGICPVHHSEVQLLKLCPICQYEAPGGQLSNLSFDGLLPKPSSGDKLEACVGCESCRRLYHKGGNYYMPLLRKDVKLKNERVGQPGNGLLLRFLDEDEQGRIPVEFEACSSPEKQCTGSGPLSKVTALDYLWRHRVGKRVHGMCFWHARHPEALAEVYAARIRAPYSAGRPSVASRRTAEVIGAIYAKWETVKDNGRSYEAHLASMTQGSLSAYHRELRDICAKYDYPDVNKKLNAWFDACRLKEIFPDAPRPFKPFLKFVVGHLKSGMSIEKISSELEARRPAKQMPSAQEKPHKH
jgi:hypothetical protein